MTPPSAADGARERGPSGDSGSLRRTLPGVSLDDIQREVARRRGGVFQRLPLYPKQAAVVDVTHAFISTEFALLALPAGLLWGWLYDRQRTLICPILSHILIGAAAFEVISVLGQATQRPQDQHRHGNQSRAGRSMRAKCGILLGTAGAAGAPHTERGDTR